MAVPDFQTLMLPTLRALLDGNVHASSEIRDSVARELALSPGDLEQKLPSGRQTVFANRVAWALVHMENADLVSRERRGFYRLAQRGRDAINAKVARVDMRYLAQFEEYRSFRVRSSDDTQHAPTTSDAPTSPSTNSAAERTPKEVIGDAFRQLRSAVEAEVLAQLAKVSPTYFEEIVVQLLVAMGYGGSVEEAGQRVGRSGDGGLDGLIKEDRLGLDVIYVQAKRWQGSVGRPDVQAFAGSLEGARARKGVFITTSRYSEEARAYVERIEKKIVLIDGARLASLMFDFGLGVATEQAYEIKRLDLDFFVDE